MKKYYIETYGCQMNFAQSTQLDKQMHEYGFKQADALQQADIIIINACSVRQHAEDRVFNRINYLNSLKKKHDFKLVVTGCFGQNNRQVDADYVIGTYKMDSIPRIIANGFKEKYVNVDMDEYHFLQPVREEKFPFRSLVDITKGCDNYCSYCIVPYVRGPQYSRPSRDVLEHIKVLAGQGVKEIVLLGQNVNSYGQDNHDISFAELLTGTNEIDGLARIRFITSHPKDFSDEIIAAVFNNSKVCPSIHLPLQSGSDRILKAMNRKYTMEKYLAIIEKIRAWQQDFFLSTDLLVGFPGETEADFMQTIEAAEKIRFNEAFTFKYSARPQILANKLPDQVPEAEKAHRLDHLIKIQKEIEKEKIKDSLNKTRTVLIEKTSKKDTAKFMGRDELNYMVVIEKSAVIGDLIKVRIKAVKGMTLIGEA